jgi:hypothetical protein
MLSCLIAYKAKHRMKSPLNNLLWKHLSMTHLLVHRLKLWSRPAFLPTFLAALLVCAFQPRLHADPTPVRKFQGTYHGFLELRSPDGQVVAYGDSTQVVRGDQITAETLFTFKDGSIDDETTVYTQHRTFQLISDHHVQKGPFFPHPTEVFIDARTGQVSTRTTGKDGKGIFRTDKLQLPADLANGMVPLIIENMGSAAQKTVSLVISTPKALLVQLVISKIGDDSYSLVGTNRKATHYELKIVLGGIVGVVAPLIGKTPPNIEIWAVTGQAPTFVKEQGPLYADGPVMTIELISPTWPDSSKSGN